MARKNITIKVHRPSGEFIETWDNARFESFTKSINGGLGNCKIELGEDFGFTSSGLQLNNEVRIWISDTDTTEVIYSGYVSKYESWIEGHRSGITVNLLGYYTKLGQDIWKNGTTTTFDYGGSATDIGSIFKTLLDRYKAETTNPRLTYTNDTVKQTSTTTEYRFEFLTYREGVDKLKSLAPQNWFWYVDENRVVYFKEKSSSIDHRFIAGRHFNRVRVERSMEKIKNIAMVYSNTADVANKLVQYSNTASVNDYGRRVRKISDSRVSTSTDMDKIGNRFINEHKNPDVKVVAEIIDNNLDDNFGYDIETIDPGDTCLFSGFDESLSNIFEYNMLITRVEYLLTSAIITIEPMKSDVISRTEETTERVDALEREDVPTSYST